MRTNNYHSGHINTVRMLVEKGAEVNRQNKAGRTALHVAAAEGNL